MLLQSPTKEKNRDNKALIPPPPDDGFHLTEQIIQAGGQPSWAGPGRAARTQRATAPPGRGCGSVSNQLFGCQRGAMELFLSDLRICCSANINPEPVVWRGGSLPPPAGQQHTVQLRLFLVQMKQALLYQAFGEQVVAPESAGPRPLPHADRLEEVRLSRVFESNPRPVLCLGIGQRWVLLLDRFNGNPSVDVFAAPVSVPLWPPLLKVQHGEARLVGGDVVLDVILGQLLMALQVYELRQALVVYLAGVFVHVGEDAKAVGVE
ncbi:hypothetical protein FQN60_014341 [Etheostoma spectabile]|uniref:Uncharacterized protein n=1 Tax=Etheostoma spectabile TaxID=54343 RepID=A0A5J5D8J2_9PERO|nr:hypothetical protein FQN60_014341 [Etheostoma spectabile]